MKELQLAISSQKTYSGIESKKPMADVSSVETISPGSSGGKPPAKRAEVKEHPPKEPLAVTDEQNNAAQEGVEAYVAEKINEELRGTEHSGSASKDVTPPVSAEASIVEGESLAKVYFQEVPAPLAIAKGVYRFCEEAEGRPLAELETRFLTRHYLLLQNQAEKAGHDIRFLSPLKNELSRRGVRVENAVKRAAELRRRVRPVAGGERGDRAEVEVSEVFANARLTEGDRLEKAREMLKEQRKKEKKNEDLTEREKKAILDAHEVGRRESGRVSSEEAGVYNYTREQLKRKAIILKQGGFSREERRMLLGAGIAGISTAGILNPRLLDEAEVINGLLDALGPNDIDTLKEGLERVIRLNGAVPVPADQKQLLRDRIATTLRNETERRAQDRREQEEESRERYAHGIFHERKLTPEQKRIIRTGADDEVDDIFNRMFDRVDANPKAHFSEAFGQAGSNEYDEFIATLNEAADESSDVGRTLTGPQRERANKRVKYYADERKVRELTHSMNFAVISNIGTEKLHEFAQGFDAGLTDIAFSKLAVVQAMHFYEQAFLQVREENEGYIPYEAVVGDPKTGAVGRVEEIARKLLVNAAGRGMIKDANGNVIRELKEWQINRALGIARGMGIATGRTIEIAATSLLPRDNTLVSIYAQDIIKHIAPFRHMFGKFKIGKERIAVLGYLLNKRGGPWTQDELKTFYGMSNQAFADVMNGLVEDKDARFLSVLNPLKIGGIFSKTLWRYGEEIASTTTGVMLKDREWREWIGSGMWIEKERGNLGSTDVLSDDDQQQTEIDFGRRLQTKGEQADARIRKELLKIANIQPLKLLYNLRDLQTSVMERMHGVYPRGMEKDVQLKEDLEVLMLLQEEAVQNHRSQLNIGPELVADDGQRQRLETLTRIIREEFTTGGNQSRMDKFIKDLKDRDYKLPFIFGTDDMPFDRYEFVKTGGSSIARRWRDINSARTAADALTTKLIPFMDSFKGEEGMGKIIEVMREIYVGISGYDEGLAREFTQKLAEGIIKFYAKDWMSRLPLGIGTLWGISTGRASYAQTAFGREAPAWDEIEVGEFTRLLRTHGMLTLEQQHALQARAGGGKKEVAYAFARVLIPILMLGLAYYLIKKVKDEKD